LTDGRSKRSLPRATAGLGKLSFPGGNDNRRYPTKNTAVQEQSKARLNYLARQLQALGPASLFHFLEEIDRGADLRSQLETNAALPAEFIRAYGGDEFLPAVHLVQEGRL
jgi:hypothetical protein